MEDIETHLVFTHEQLKLSAYGKYPGRIENFCPGGIFQIQ